jgi:hypothetical protein
MMTLLLLTAALVHAQAQDPQTLAALALVRSYAADEVSREDLRRAEEAIGSMGVRVKWGEGYANESNYIHEPLKTAYVRTKGIDGTPYPPERLAGAFLHEVAGHAYAFSKGCGTNMAANELDAWYIQMRFYAAVRHRLGQDRFLDSTFIEDLRLFEEDRGAFDTAVLAPYYGTEIEPGEETAAEQRKSLLRRKGEGAGRAVSWFLGSLGLMESQASIDEKLRRLSNDEMLDSARLQADARWRARMAEECAGAGKGAPACRVR